MNFHHHLGIILLALTLLESCAAFHHVVHTMFSNVRRPRISSITSPLCPLPSSSSSSPPQQQYNSLRHLTNIPLYSSVKVYNNVINEETCKHVHKLTLEITQRSRDGSFLFYRGRSRRPDQKKLTPIETTIDQILTSLNDTSPIVEYWSRLNYINMDAHADIDENTLKDEGVLRVPRNGHVLYMQIANNTNNDPDDDDNDSNDDGKIMGPTVVFPNRKVAWGSVTPRTPPPPISSSVGGAASFHSQANRNERSIEYIVDVENYWDDEQRRQYGYGTDDDDAEGEEEIMTIVPAVDGRLLRFDGAAFHAVPKPPDRYLLSERELDAFLKKEKEEEDCGDDDEDDDGNGYYWDDDDDDDDDCDEEEEKCDPSNQRSVLLFNTWPEGSEGPRGVFPDRVVDDVPDGIEIEVDDDDNDAANVNSPEEERYHQWQKIYGEQFERVWCNPFEEWAVEEIYHPSSSSVDGPSTSKGIVTVPLMGNPARRGCTLTKSELNGSVANRAFYEESKVSAVMLERIKE